MFALSLVVGCSEKAGTTKSAERKPARQNDEIQIRPVSLGGSRSPVERELQNRERQQSGTSERAKLSTRNLPKERRVRKPSAREIRKFKRKLYVWWNTLDGWLRSLTPSPLHYALGELSPRQERLRYQILVESIEGALPVGRTLNYQPQVDMTDFAGSDWVSTDETGHWSFQRLRQITPPSIDDDNYRVRNSIDAFVVDQLIEQNLPQSPTANPADLVRRLCYDATGLPPSFDQQRALASEFTEESYQELVESLFNEKGFGERWARFWLDLARYADSDGYEEDDMRPRAFSYRDFAIWAMNRDLPFKLFVQWQIAGDQLEPENPMAVAATGFLTAGPLNVFFPQPSERMDELDDMVSTLGRSMLGLSIGCARCHEHRYDPIPTEDYYQLVAVFKNTKRDRPFLVPDGGKEYRSKTDCVTNKRAEIMKMLYASVIEQNIEDLDEFTDKEKDLLRQPVDENNKEQAELLSRCMRCLSVTLRELGDDTELLDEYQDRYGQLKQSIVKLAPKMPPPAPTGLCIADGEATKTHVLSNGDLKRPEGEVHPGFLTALTRSQPQWDEDLWRQWAPDESVATKSADDVYPRAALAIWMTDTENGAGALLARVIVNRIWQQYFDRGIVDTPSDFGLLGSDPTHPELLEWLAGELVANDWSLKHIHRLILNSATYRQSSENNSAAASIDSANQFVWRQNRKRLTAEMLRDSMLVAGGNLNRKMYGPGIMPTIPHDAVFFTQLSAEETWPMLGVNDPEAFRRSVYIVTKRSMSVPLMKLFDAPDGSLSCEVRTNTTVPTQALALWNSDFVRSQSRRTAKQICRTLGDDHSPEKFTRAAYRRILLREPTEDEVVRCAKFLRSFQDKDADMQLQACSELCQVLILTNEFAYLN